LRLRELLILLLQLLVSALALGLAGYSDTGF